MMNPYLSGGTKELQAASLVVEPLARYDETGALVPWLAKSVPTVENGGISSDLRTITWSLKSGYQVVEWRPCHSGGHYIHMEVLHCAGWWLCTEYEFQ